MACYFNRSPSARGAQVESVFPQRPPKFLERDFSSEKVNIADMTRAHLVDGTACSTFQMVREVCDSERLGSTFRRRQQLERSYTGKSTPRTTTAQ